MTNQILPIVPFNNKFNNFLPNPINQQFIYQSAGLKRHIEKRHPECLQYLNAIPYIINHPDYIGINPNESGTSFELVKVIDNNVQLGIKLDANRDYLYVATLHTITNSKLQHGIENGRLKKFDK